MLWLFAIPGLFALLFIHQRWDEGMEAKHGDAYTRPRERILGWFFKVATWLSVLVMVAFVLTMCATHQRGDSSRSYDASETDRD